jgi:acyl-CoA thioesterase-1
MKVRGRPFVTAVLLFSLLMTACGEEAPKPTAAPAKPLAASKPEPAYEGAIVCMGDSLTEGLGVAEEEAYPARLQRRLQADGLPWKVVNAGISGETSAGALSRVRWVMSLQPDVIILETGANDGLRGLDVDRMESHIDEMVAFFREREVVVVLAGMQMVSNLGPDYTARFAAVYPRVAERHDLVFLPFFLEGVAMDPTRNLSDGIHPNAEGYRVIVDRLYPYVLEAIERVRERRPGGRGPRPVLNPP